MAEIKVGRRSHASKMIGLTFTRLTVEKATDQRTANKEVIYQCRCVCGKAVFVRGSSLLTGGTRSCGCLRNERSKLAMLRRHAEQRAQQPQPPQPPQPPQQPQPPQPPQPPEPAKQPPTGPRVRKDRPPPKPSIPTPLTGLSGLDLIWMEQARAPKVRYAQ